VARAGDRLIQALSRAIHAIYQAVTRFVENRRDEHRPVELEHLRDKLVAQVDLSCYRQVFLRVAKPKHKETLLARQVELVCGLAERHRVDVASLGHDHRRDDHALAQGTALQFEHFKVASSLA